MTMQTEIRLRKPRPLSNDQKSQSPPQACRQSIVQPKIRNRICTAMGPRRISVEQKWVNRVALEPDLLTPSTQIKPPRECRRELKSLVPRLLRTRQQSPVKKIRLVAKGTDADLKHSNQKRHMMVLQMKLNNRLFGQQETTQKINLKRFQQQMNTNNISGSLNTMKDLAGGIVGSISTPPEQPQLKRFHSAMLRTKQPSPRNKSKYTIIDIPSEQFQINIGEHGVMSGAI